jgi:hypothetical protein
MEEITVIDFEGTGKSPHVEFNHLTGELVLSGRSIPENAAKIYEPLLTWISRYLEAPQPTTNLRINLDYYNTTSAIWLIKIIRALSEIKIKNSVLIIHVYLETEDFEDMELEDIKDVIASIYHKEKELDLSIGMKMYAIDSSGKVVKESTVLF